MTEIIERTCRDCGADFSVGPEAVAFFQRRGLALPWRCRDCRDMRRRERGERVDGRVLYYDVARGQGIIDVDGERIIVFAPCVNRTDLPLRAGDAVSLEIIDGTPLRRANQVFRE